MGDSAEVLRIENFLFPWNFRDIYLKIMPNGTFFCKFLFFSFCTLFSLTFLILFPFFIFIFLSAFAAVLFILFFSFFFSIGLYFISFVALLSILCRVFYYISTTRLTICISCRDHNYHRERAGNGHHGGYNRRYWRNNRRNYRAIAALVDQPPLMMDYPPILLNDW